MRGTTPVIAVVAAAGLGQRLKAQGPKAFVSLAGRPLLYWTLTRLSESVCIDEIVVILPSENFGRFEEIVSGWKIGKLIACVPGGSRRQDSVKNGLAAIRQAQAIVLVHDGARPFVDAQIVDRVVDAVVPSAGVVAGVPVNPTVKKVGSDGFVEKTIDRQGLWEIQTPQGFFLETIRAAYDQLGDEDVTDDASVLERAGYKICVVQGSHKNIKVTTPEDLVMGELLLSGAEAKTVSSPVSARVGFGYDIHRFASGRKLFLGGVEIPSDRGLLGHSDADVILHAVCDALLGALALGDIGRHFPDSDPAYKDISSLQLLKNVARLVSEKGFVIENIDVMLIMESPKIAVYVERMRQAISGASGAQVEVISIKATTQERVGEIGRGEAAACYAVASVRGLDRQGGKHDVSV